MKIILNFIAAIGVFAAVFSLAFLFMLLLAWPVMWLWNGAIVNALSVAKPIDYWTALGVLIFIQLFKNPPTTTSSKD